MVVRQTQRRAAEPFRRRVQELLRESILDEAYHQLVERDWNAVRMQDIAAAVGVSRQRLHAECGTKDDLAQAVLARELQVCVDHVLAISAQAPSLPEAISESFVWLLAHARADAMLQRMLADARRGAGGQEALAMLTVHAERVLGPLSRALAELYGRRWPGTSPARADLAIDVALRLGLTHVFTPSGLPDEQVAAGITEMLTDYLRGYRASPLPEQRR